MIFVQPLLIRPCKYGANWGFDPQSRRFYFIG